MFLTSMEGKGAKERKKEQGRAKELISTFLAKPLAVVVKLKENNFCKYSRPYATYKDVNVRPWKLESCLKNE